MNILFIYLVVTSLAPPLRNMKQQGGVTNFKDGVL